MTDHDKMKVDPNLDLRIADALFDAASSTATSDDALNEILQRAAVVPARFAARRVAIGAATLGVTAAGVTGIVVVSNQPDEQPVTTEIAAAPTTLPTAGTVADPVHFDDATLLAQLYSNYGVAERDEASRLFGDWSDSAAIAPCMEEAGYPYVAAPDPVEHLSADPRYLVPAEEFAAQYGFGRAAEALGLLPPQYPTDPNGDYLSTLSGAEQETYKDAATACFQEQIDSGELEIMEQSWINAHDYAWAEFKKLVDSDDRVVEALRTWTGCMAVAGFDVTTPEVVAVPFATRVYDAGFVGEPLQRGTPEFAAIEQIMAEEIAVATANADCVAPYESVVREVLNERFPEYKSILEAALDAGVESDANG